MENDKTMQFPQGEPIYEKPQFMEVNASFVFGDTNPESGGRDDGGDTPGSKAGDEGEFSDDDY